MIHGWTHIARTWKKEAGLLRLVLSALVPALALAFISVYLHISLIELLMALGISFIRLVCAYVLSLILGVGIAMLVANAKRGSEQWIALFDVMQNIPSFALIPLFVMWLGYTNVMVVVFATSAIVWPILFSTVTAIHSARPSLAEAATLFGANGDKRMMYFYLPLAYPAILTGSIVGVSIGWESVIGVEIISSISGIGRFLNTASQGDNIALLIGGLSALLVAVFIINRAVWSPLLRRSYLYNE